MTMYWRSIGAWGKEERLCCYIEGSRSRETRYGVTWIHSSPHAGCSTRHVFRCCSWTLQRSTNTAIARAETPAEGPSSTSGASASQLCTGKSFGLTQPRMCDARVMYLAPYFSLQFCTDHCANSYQRAGISGSDCGDALGVSGRDYMLGVGDSDSVGL